VITLAGAVLTAISPDASSSALMPSSADHSTVPWNSLFDLVTLAFLASCWFVKWKLDGERRLGARRVATGDRARSGPLQHLDG
jgi:hypothetical protein